jgi:hypothetical protein
MAWFGLGDDVAVGGCRTHTYGLEDSWSDGDHVAALRLRRL